MSHRVASSETPSEVRVRLQVGGIQVERGPDGFHSVQVQNLDPLHQLGRPELVTSEAPLALPPGVEASLQVHGAEPRF